MKTQGVTSIRGGLLLLVATALVACSGLVGATATPDPAVVNGIARRLGVNASWSAIYQAITCEIAAPGRSVTEVTTDLKKIAEPEIISSTLSDAGTRDVLYVYRTAGLGLNLYQVVVVYTSDNVALESRISRIIDSDGTLASVAVKCDGP